MDNLLHTAVEAHGGLARWNQFSSVETQAAITGAIWHVKGRPDVLKDVAMVAATQHEHVVTTFRGQDRRTIFEPHRISVESSAGVVRETRENPEESFVGHTRETPWDDVHVAYFSGEALWTYLTTPFLYTYPGFQTEEIAPWEERGEIWRRLKVTFPETVASHCREQISYFGPDGLLRRHDYTVDILGGATGANYATDYRESDGIIVPTTRRIYAFEGDHVAVPEPLLVAIDLREVAFR